MFHPFDYPGIPWKCEQVILQSGSEAARFSRGRNTPSYPNWIRSWHLAYHWGLEKPGMAMSDDRKVSCLLSHPSLKSPVIEVI